MFSCKYVFAYAALSLLGLSMALPEPHTGMVDNGDIRDVGAIYSKPNYQGTHNFIYEIKGKPDCLALYVFTVSMPAYNS
jgi:hypothetical protein